MLPEAITPSRPPPKYVTVTKVEFDSRNTVNSLNGFV